MTHVLRLEITDMIYSSLTSTIKLLEYDGFWVAVMFEAESSGSKLAVEVLAEADRGRY